MLVKLFTKGMKCKGAQIPNYFFALSSSLINLSRISFNFAPSLGEASFLKSSVVRR